MAALMITRCSRQYRTYLQATIRQDIRTKRSHCTINRRVKPSVIIGLKPNYCRHVTSEAASTAFQNKKMVRKNVYRTSKTGENENDPDQFGNLKDAYIEPTRWQKRAAISEATRINKTQIKPRVKTKLEKTATVTDKGDIFGQIGLPIPTQTDDLPTDDEGDKLEEEYASRIPKFWKTTREASTKMKELIRERRLGEALALLKEVIEIDRTKPDSYMYNVLIGGCGRAGYSSMAFQLYKQMRERALEPDGSTYTGLFNACANSPFPEQDLKKASGLYQKLMERGINFNHKTYHAAIKAFGRCGDLRMAFHLVDEMVRNRIVVTTETFTFLLSGCATDTASGFLQAIRVWKKMREKRLRPDAFTYDLLLRTVRDCSLGDPEFAEQLLLIQNWEDSPDLKRLPKPDQQEKSGNITTTKELTVQNAQLPDILSPNSNRGDILALRAAETPQDRFLMLGGLTGLFHRMKKDGVKPRIQTFTLLLEIIPREEAEENLLLKIMKESAVKPDIDFFNVLIKQRNCRKDFESAKNVLQLIAENHLHVDIATFGTLALGCTKFKDGMHLLQDMDGAGFRPNIEIMGALAHKAMSAKNFWYLIKMLKVIRSHDISPCTKLITELEEFVVSTKNYIVEQEKQGVKFQDDDTFIRGYRTFLRFYKIWMKEMSIALPEHPWEAYKEHLK